MAAGKPACQPADAIKKLRRNGVLNSNIELKAISLSESISIQQIPQSAQHASFFFTVSGTIG